MHKVIKDDRAFQQWLSFPISKGDKLEIQAALMQDVMDSLPTASEPVKSWVGSQERFKLLSDLSWQWKHMMVNDFHLNERASDRLADVVAELVTHFREQMPFQSGSEQTQPVHASLQARV